MRFKTMATYKVTGEKVVIESDYPSKAQFVKDVRRNGYKVTAKHVKPSAAYDWIVTMTNCYPEDWDRLPDTPSCSGCKYFKRNEHFPNRYGKCEFHSKETHDTWTCDMHSEVENE